MCSETDSTNECSDFKSELDDDEDPQRKTSGLQPQPPPPQTRTKKDSRVVFVWEKRNKNLLKNAQITILHSAPTILLLHLSNRVSNQTYPRKLLDGTKNFSLLEKQKIIFALVWGLLSK